MSPLRRIAKIVPVTGQPEVSPDNLQPMIAVTGRIAEFILLLFLHERSWLPIIIIACSLLSTTADCWSCRNGLTLRSSETANSPAVAGINQSG